MNTKYHTVSHCYHHNIPLRSPPIMNSRVYQHRSNAANETRFSHIDTHGHARSPQFVSPMPGNQSDARNGDTATLASSSSASTSSSSAARNNAAFETSDAASATSSYNASFIVQQQQQHHQYQYHGRAQQQQRRASPSLQSLSSLSCSEDSSCTGLMMLYANTSVNTSNVTVTPSTAREQMYRNTHPFVSLEADSKHRGYMNINSTNATPTRTNRTTTTPSALPEVPVLLDTFQHNSNSKYNCIPPKSIIAPSFTRHEKNTTKSNSNGNGNGNALSDLLLEMSSSSWDSSATSSNSAIANANSGANDYSNHDHDTLSVASGLVSLKMNTRNDITIANVHGTIDSHSHTHATSRTSTPGSVPLKKRRVVGYGEDHVPSFMMMDRFRSPIRSHLVSVSASRSTPVSVSTPAKASIATSPIRPRTLALPSDNGNVNSLHQFVRSSLLEIFQVKNKNKNGSTTTKQSKQQSNLFPKRVGLCCVYCKNIPKNEQSTHAIIFPKNVQGMYRAVCGFQRIHFKNCASVPQEVRDHYEFLKSSDKTRGKTKFWETSAKAIGLRDSVCEGGKAGIVFSSQSSPV
jgi:hypothetical protein